MFKTSYEDMFSGQAVKTLTAYQIVSGVASTPDGFALFAELSDSDAKKLDLMNAYVIRLLRMDSRLESFKAQEVWSAAMRVHNKLASADAKLCGHNNFNHLGGNGVFNDQLMLANIPEAQPVPINTEPQQAAQ